MSVTLRDIAEQAQVSQTAVSLVLNGKYRQARITTDCAQRVRQVAEQLGYRPNRAARATASGRFGSIALMKVQSNIGLGQLPEGLLNGIEAKSTKMGLHLNFCAVDSDFEKPGKMPAILREHCVDGFLLFGDWEPTDRLASVVRKLKLPQVAVGVKGDVDSIYPAEAAACRQATERLIAAGHRRIAHIPDDRLPRYAQMERCKGYEAAMTAAGLAVESVKLPSEYRRVEVRPWEDRVAQRREFLAREDRPTALVVDSVELAYPLLADAWKLGMSLPDDLAMITFHDVAASALGICIDTMLLRCSELGSSAVDLLQKRINEGEPQPAIRMNYEYLGGYTV